MRSAKQLESEELLPRRSALWTAFALWAAGILLVGASAWRMHLAARTDEMRATPPGIEAVRRAPSDNAPTEVAPTVESEAIMFMPGDVVVGHNRPRMGATQMQKP
jgi:hypothetical protein